MSVNPPTSAPPPGARPIWGSYAGGDHASSGQAANSNSAGPSPTRAANSAVVAQTSAWIAGGEPLTPHSRRLLQVAGLLSLLLVAVLVNSFLRSSEENPLNPIAAAAQRTQTQPGARFTMKAIYTSSLLPRPMTAHGAGAFNSQTGRSRVVLRLDSPEAGEVEIDTRSDGTSLYMRGTGISGELPGGKEWIAMQPFLGHSEQEAMLSGGDADSSLQMLSSVDGSYTEMGREGVRGVPTRRYRTSVELDGYAELLRDEGKDELAGQYEKLATLMPEPVIGEASIDAKGIVRRSRVMMTMPTEPGKPALTMDLRMEFFDFGARPEIALPGSSEVFDATPLLEEQLDSIETD